MFEGKSKKKAMYMPSTVFVLFGDQEKFNLEVMPFAVVAYPLRQCFVEEAEGVTVEFGLVEGQGQEPVPGIADSVFIKHGFGTGYVGVELFVIDAAFFDRGFIVTHDAFGSQYVVLGYPDVFAAVVLNDNHAALVLRFH